MKNKTKLIALTLGVILLTLSGLSSNANAQFGRQIFANTGLVKLGPDESMTVSVVGSDRDNRAIHIEFLWSGYRWSPGANGIMVYSRVFNGISGGDIERDGAISFDPPTSSGGNEATGGVQVQVQGPCRPPYLCDYVVTGQIFRLNRATGRRDYVGHVTIAR